MRALFSSWQPDSRYRAQWWSRVGGVDRRQRRTDTLPGRASGLAPLAALVARSFNMAPRDAENGVPVAAEPKVRSSASEGCRPSVGPRPAPGGPPRTTVLPGVVLSCRWLWRRQGCSVQNGRHPGANGFIEKPNGHQRHLHDQPEAIGQTPREDLMIARRQ